MPIVENAPDSGQELRWREWQEMGRSNDRKADKRMKVVFFVIGLVLLALVLYYAFRPKISADSDYVRRALRYDHNSILVALRPADVIGLSVQ
jgi:hypothetical protein